MPERPHPDLDRVRDALGERDQTMSEPEPEAPQPEDEPEDDGEA